MAFACFVARSRWRSPTGLAATFSCYSTISVATFPCWSSRSSNVSRCRTCTVWKGMETWLIGSIRKFRHDTRFDRVVERIVLFVDSRMILNWWLATVQAFIGWSVGSTWARWLCWASWLHRSWKSSWMGVVIQLGLPARVLRRNTSGLFGRWASLVSLSSPLFFGFPPLQFAGNFFFSLLSIL